MYLAIFVLFIGLIFYLLFFAPSTYDWRKDDSD